MVLRNVRNERNKSLQCRLVGSRRNEITNEAMMLHLVKVSSASFGAVKIVAVLILVNNLNNLRIRK